MALRQHSKEWDEVSPTSSQKTQLRFEEELRVPLMKSESLVGILLIKHLHPKAFALRETSTFQLSEKTKSNRFTGPNGMK